MNPPNTHHAIAGGVVVPPPPPRPPPSFRHLLRGQLALSGESPAELAEAIGVSRRTVVGWLAGERLPLPDHVWALVQRYRWSAAGTLEALAGDAATRRGAP